MSKTIKIPGRIESTETGNVVALAKHIYDDAKGKKQNVINQETDAAIAALGSGKQDVLTFDNTPTEGSDNPVKSGGVYTATFTLSQAIEAILLLIPAAASELNKLADKNFVNSSIATDTATFRGTSAPGLSEQQFLAWANTLTHDLNDYVFWNTVDSVGNTQFKRYKWNGEQWMYEYTLNNSSFTADQWAAITSGITQALVAKLSALPTASDLQIALNAKQDALTFDNVPVAGSNNPVKSGGLYSTISPIQLAVDALTGRMTTAEGNISTNTADIALLQDLYEALTQSALVVVEPTDTWPVANPATKTIYRVVDRVNTPPQYYSDYMYNGTSMVLMATYNNAIDDVPTPDSNNLAKSGGIAAMYGSYRDDVDYLKVEVDSEGRIIKTIHKDGKMEVPGGIKTGKSEADELNIGENILSSHQNDEYLELKVDSDNRVIEGVDKKGRKIFGEIPYQIKDYVDKAYLVENFAIANLYIDGNNTITSGGTLLYFVANENDKIEIVNNTIYDWNVCFSINPIGNFAISQIIPAKKSVIKGSNALVVVPSDAKHVCVYTTSDSEEYPTIKNYGNIHNNSVSSINEKLAFVINRCLRYYINVILPYYYPNEDMGFVGSDEGSIRPLAWIAYSSAILLDSGNFNEDIAGCSKEEVQHQIHRITTNLIDHHKANTSSNDSWGDIWQSAWWASTVASVVSILPSLFSDGYVEKAKLMIENECDYVLSHYSNDTSLYWKNKEGQVLNPGDTKADEVTWHVNCLMLGALLNVNAEKTVLYKTEAVRRLIIAYSTPTDYLSPEDINGYVLSALNGSNVQENGLIVNHNKYSPEYQIALCTPFHTIPVFSKLKTKMPVAFNFNSELMCKAVTDIIFEVSQGYISPGGTMYKHGRQQVYYPQGFDWGSEMYMDKLMFDVICSTFEINPAINFEGWARMHADRIMNLQNRYENGRVFTRGDEEYRGYDSLSDVPYKRETTVSMYFAVALACLNYPISWTDESWTDVSKVIINSNSTVNTNIERRVNPTMDFNLLYTNTSDAVITLQLLDSSNNVIEMLVTERTVSGNGRVAFTSTETAVKLRLVTTNAKDASFYISRYV